MSYHRSPDRSSPPSHDRAFQRPRQPPHDNDGQRDALHMRNSGPPRPHAGGRPRGFNSRGGFGGRRAPDSIPGSASGMRRTNTYHQQQQDIARTLAQRRLQRQNEGRSQSVHNDNRYTHPPPRHGQQHPNSRSLLRQAPPAFDLAHQNRVPRQMQGGRPYGYQPTAPSPHDAQRSLSNFRIARPAHSFVRSISRSEQGQKRPSTSVSRGEVPLQSKQQHQRNSKPPRKPSDVIDLLFSDDEGKEEDTNNSPPPSTSTRPSSPKFSGPEISRNNSDVSSSSRSTSVDYRTKTPKPKPLPLQTDAAARVPLEDQYMASRPAPSKRSNSSQLSVVSVPLGDADDNQRSSKASSSEINPTRGETSSGKTLIQLSSSDDESSDEEDENDDDDDEEAKVSAPSPRQQQQGQVAGTSPRRTIEATRNEENRTTHEPLADEQASMVSTNSTEAKKIIEATLSKPGAASGKEGGSVSATACSTTWKSSSIDNTDHDADGVEESSGEAKDTSEEHEEDEEEEEVEEEESLASMSTGNFSSSHGAKGKGGAEYRYGNTASEDEDSGSSSDREEEEMEMEDRSSDDDEDADDHDDLAQLAKKPAARNWSVKTARKSTAIMRGLAKAPVSHRYKQEFRIYSDSESEEDINTDSSSCSSSSESESESEDERSSGSWSDVGRYRRPRDIERFGQKTAANSVFFAREKQAARKSATLTAPRQSSQSTVSDDDIDEEVVSQSEAIISRLEEGEPNEDDSGREIEGEPVPRNEEGSVRQMATQPQEVARDDTVQQSNGNGGSVPLRTKRKRYDLQEDETPSIPLQKIKRSKAKRDSDGDDKSKSDASSEVLEGPNIKTPSSLLKRRRRSGPLRFSFLESPHAKTGRSDGENDRLMTRVEHLTKVAMNPETGLPFMKMTAHAEDAEILYDFRVDVATSSIQGAGNGAYLTFLGARHLKDEAFSKSPQKPIQKPLQLEDSLEAASSQGYGIHVKVTGESMDPQRTQRPEGIGPNYVFSESDYEPSPTTVFSSKGKGNGLLYLGRYGPFRSSDRKTVCHFDVKSFVLGYEPSEWSFGVDEPLFDREDQIIDITDDLTGKPHQVARNNLPMYVNEVGHDKTLIQNVDSRTRFDRSVDYYIKIDIPMKKGDKVELLTDYFETYEGVRLRKGYGKEGLKSDADPKARYERNVDLRTIIASKVRDLDLFATFQLMEFVEETIHQPLVCLIGRFLKAQQDDGPQNSAPVPLCQQCVALIRLRLLGACVLKHLTDLELKLHKIRNIESGYPWEGMLQQAKAWAGGMNTIDMSGLWQLGVSVNDSEGRSIHKALRGEILELRWNDLKKELQSPFNPNMWSPLAIGLIDELSWEVTTHTQNEEESLVERLYSIAAKTAETVRKEAARPPANDSCLRFDSDVMSDRACVSPRQIRTLKESMLAGHSLNSKAALSGALDLLTYFDCSFLIDDPPFAGAGFSLPVDPNKQLLMTKFEGFRNGSPLCSIPKSAEDCQRTKTSVNVDWYLVWQVAYIVNAFAAGGGFLPTDSAEKYSLQELCRIVGVDHEIAQPAIGRGIRRKKVEAGLRRKSSKAISSKSKKTTNRTKKSVAGGLKTRAPAVEISCGPPDEPLEGGWPPGWEKKVFERQSGASKGHRDRYWYTPQHKYKLRSMLHVKRFLACLRTVGNNEELAWKFFHQQV